jgi:hypothetical protein
MFTAPQIATLAAAYSKATQTSLSALGVLIFSDHRFFKNLASGRDCTTGNAAVASRWLIDNWPADAEWPVDVPRQDVEAA